MGRQPCRRKLHATKQAGDAIPTIREDSSPTGQKYDVPADLRECVAQLEQDYRIPDSVPDNLWADVEPYFQDEVMGGPPPQGLEGPRLSLVGLLWVLYHRYRWDLLPDRFGDAGSLFVWARRLNRRGVWQIIRPRLELEFPWLNPASELDALRLASQEASRAQRRLRKEIVGSFDLNDLIDFLMVHYRLPWPEAKSLLGGHITWLLDLWDAFNSRVYPREDALRLVAEARAEAARQRAELVNWSAAERVADRGEYEKSVQVFEKALTILPGRLADPLPSSLPISNGNPDRDSSSSSLAQTKSDLGKEGEPEVRRDRKTEERDRFIYKQCIK